MALRLQSNLLCVLSTLARSAHGANGGSYGVARVYSQQCGYVLTDAESARNNIRLSLRALRQAGLEPEGSNKAKSVYPLLAFEFVSADLAKSGPVDATR